MSQTQGDISYHELSKVDIHFDQSSMRAWIKLLPGEFVSIQTLRRSVQQANVCYGLLLDGLREAMVPAEKQRIIVLAQGQEQVNGRDSRLETAFQEEAPYDIRSDGSIDFKARSGLIKVTSGEMLAKVLPPTMGVRGMDVLGRPLLQDVGEEIPLENFVDEGVTPDKADHSIKAVRTGIFMRKSSGAMAVLDCVIIEGDVDFETGNIEVNKPVLIKGDVKAGFRVVSEGDISIDGAVEDAEVKSAGNIMVRGGILPGEKNISAKGDMSAAFISSRKVAAKNIYVQQYLMHANIEAENEVVALSIVGGHIYAGQKITVSKLGSDGGEPTLVSVGTNMRQKRLLQHEQQANPATTRVSRVQKELEEAEELSTELSHRAQVLVERNAIKSAVNKIVRQAQEAMRRRDVLNRELAEAMAASIDSKERLAELAKTIYAAENPHIEVLLEVFPGVEVEFREHLRRHIITHLGHCEFNLRDGEIIVHLPH